MLAENLYFYRKKKGLSRRELGESAGGIHPATIAAIEGGRSITPRGDKVSALARALGVTTKMLTDARPPEMRVESREVLLRVSMADQVDFTDKEMHLIHNIMKSVIDEIAKSKRKRTRAKTAKKKRAVRGRGRRPK